MHQPYLKVKSCVILLLSAILRTCIIVVQGANICVLDLYYMTQMLEYKTYLHSTAYEMFSGADIDTRLKKF